MCNSGVAALEQLEQLLRSGNGGKIKKFLKNPKLIAKLMSKLIAYHLGYSNLTFEGQSEIVSDPFLTGHPR